HDRAMLAGQRPIAFLEGSQAKSAVWADDAAGIGRRPLLSRRLQGNDAAVERRAVGGLGIALGSHNLGDDARTGVVSRFLGPPFPNQRLLLLWHRGAAPRPQARQFAEMLRQATRGQARTGS